MVGVTTLVVIGLVAGSLARLIVPSRDALGLLSVLVLGVLGSFIGGALAYALVGADLTGGSLHPAGFAGAAVGASVSLLAWRAAAGWSRGRT